MEWLSDIIACGKTDAIHIGCSHIFCRYFPGNITAGTLVLIEIHKLVAATVHKSYIRLKCMWWEHTKTQLYSEAKHPLKKTNYRLYCLSTKGIIWFPSLEILKNIDPFNFLRDFFATCSMPWPNWPYAALPMATNDALVGSPLLLGGLKRISDVFSTGSSGEWYDPLLTRVGGGLRWWFFKPGKVAR